MRVREVLAVLIGLVVVGGVVYGGWWWLSDTLDPAEDEAQQAQPGEDPEATVAAYLDAWEAGDTTAMATLVRGETPEDFADRHRQLLAGLEAGSLVLEAGEVASEVDGRASVPVAVEVRFEDLAEPIGWDTTIQLSRERGSWGVDWNLTTIHPELRPTWRFGRVSEDVDREPILAADDTPLVGTGNLVTFGFEPTAVDDAEAIVRAFASAIPGSEAAAERELGRDDLVEGWFYEIVTVTETRADEASPRLRQAGGILRRTSTARAPYDTGFARHIVGAIEEATAEQLEGDDSLERGDRIPQFGLELVFDDQMQGSERILLGLVEGDTGPLQVELGASQADPSAPVETTIDIAVQRAVEDAIELAELPAAVVVVDTDGAIRGSASRPLGGFNRAFSGRYPPGSTFKVITAEALLAEGAGTGTQVECPAETTVGGLRVPNAGNRSLGTTTLEEAFAISCNTTFATLGGALEAERLTAAAERFGFGVEPLVPLTAFGGSFPEPTDLAERGAAAFGQARVETSPLHLASVAAATIDGSWDQPYLLRGDGPGETIPLATGTADQLRTMMRTVVTDGTGVPAAVDGEEVRGKTGSAQTTDGVTHAWFIGTWEDLGFAVLVEDGGAGGEVAGPIAARLVERLVELVRDGGDPALPAGDGPPPDEDPALEPGTDGAPDEAEDIDG
ncbi:MAG: hypothetical protein JJT89_05420 [Nitriliruptoraceae bacterium]|nr:hypothetical protein [Nitriliruptoraceae bacterium]